jgi:hypothetical protein
VPAPKAESDEVVELSKPKESDRPSLRELAAKPTATMEPQPEESDARMRRVTNPVGERKRTPSQEAIQFATDAKHALDEASKDAVPLPRTQATTLPVSESSIIGEQSVPESSPVIEIIANEPDISLHPRTEDAPAARKRAATLPPFKPPTVPPIGRRSPTIPPGVGNQPPGKRKPTDPPNVTAPPPGSLRAPAAAQFPLPGMTAPPPSTVRPPGMNYLDDMITLRPQYEQKPELVIKEGDDGSVLIEPAKKDDAAETQPRMNAVGDTTEPDVKLPESQGAALGAESSWSRGLAARLDAQLEEDFGTETPIKAPTKAELQALLNSPPDPTRKQSLDEIEALHRESRERHSQELDLDRRRPYPTSEIDEADIEAAIELAPPARRNAIGVAKKKRED